MRIFDEVKARNLGIVPLAIAASRQRELIAGGPGSGRHAGGSSGDSRSAAHLAAANAHEAAAKAFGKASYPEKAAKADRLTNAAHDKTTQAANSSAWNVHGKELEMSHMANSMNQQLKYSGGDHLQIADRHERAATFARQYTPGGSSHIPE